ncbi:hypothetical protein NDU88_004826 [Pleurodeles waltl]|uniref:Uncharacterized protein n=1 Tax=Pleurodeles waltl TaxID=8319 RepID=A0AAV7PF62_PLEWA|nr:hypothetical protein NDU88_004826 [Pleurodeles waltl]
MSCDFRESIFLVPASWRVVTESVLAFLIRCGPPANTLPTRSFPRSAAGPHIIWRCTEGPGEDRDPGAALFLCLEGLRQRGGSGGGPRLRLGLRFCLLYLAYHSLDEGGLPFYLQHSRGCGYLKTNRHRAGLIAGAEAMAGRGR